jgi:hypothetical protein
MNMVWVYATLIKGILYDDDGNRILSVSTPVFKNEIEAEQYLIDNDLRISIR